MLPEEARMLIGEVIEESGVPRTVLAEDAGLSRAALNSWTARGRAARTPEPESLRQLASGLEKRATVLQRLAERLRKAAGDRE
jgi:hypothetical protein